MNIVRKEDAVIYKNNDRCVITEYPMDDKDINGAVIKILGRYPEHGRVVNMKCKEMAYMIEGTGMAVIEGKEIMFQQGDVLLVEPGEKFFWEGHFTMFVPCAPAWYSEQHKEVE